MKAMMIQEIETAVKDMLVQATKRKDKKSTKLILRILHLFCCGD